MAPAGVDSMFGAPGVGGGNMAGLVIASSDLFPNIAYFFLLSSGNLLTKP
jgi:hypothetical protein